jgi:hypothetical protein
VLHTAHFATTQNKSITAIDNIFVYNRRLESSYTSPLINGLPEHDAQFLTINNICAPKNKIPKKQRKRIINSNTLTNFQTLPEQETWVSVYQKPHNNCCLIDLCVIFLVFMKTFSS